MLHTFTELLSTFQRSCKFPLWRPSRFIRAKKPFSRLLTLSAKKRAPKKRVTTAEEEEAAKNFKLDFKFGRP